MPSARRRLVVDGQKSNRLRPSAPNSKIMAIIAIFLSNPGVIQVVGCAGNALRDAQSWW